MQIADLLRNDIYQGELKEGERIGSELTLSEKFDVSRGTVIKAIDELVKEGIVEKIHGKGTFVTAHDISYPLGDGLLSFAETLKAQDINFQTKVLEQKIVSANENVSNKLKVDQGTDIYYLLRLRYTNEQNIMLIENRINLEVIPEIINIDLENQSLFEQIEKLTNKQIAYSESRFAARVVGKERGEILQISPESPVLHLEQIVYLEDDVAVEYGNVWLISNKYYLSTIFNRKKR